MAGHNELGKSGEDKAVAYLMQEGVCGVRAQLAVGA